MTEASMPPVVADWAGHCPICGSSRFVARSTWFRDNLICQNCEGGSLPRERALMLAIRQTAPDWYNATIHESSPGSSGVSVLLRNVCRSYTPTHYFPDVPLGTIHMGYRCEDLERQTFDDEAFDLVITQDVLEHVFDPAAVHREIWRTLKPGGYHIHTTPIYKQLTATEQCARLRPDGSIEHLSEPEYHGNPADPSDPEKGSLVTFRYGYDIADLIAEWAPFDVEIRRFNDRTHGIVAEFTEVIVCRRRD